MRTPIPLQVACDVIDRLSAIDVSHCNGNFQTLVVERLLATGNSVEDLTLGEIRRIVAQARQDFNRS